MAVTEDLSAYSSTQASNTPAGTDTVGPDLDNHLRNIKHNIRLAGENYVSASDPPDAVRGLLHADATASPVVTLKYSDGTDWLPLFDIDESANTVTPYLGAAKLSAGTFGKAMLAEEATASAITRLALPEAVSGMIESPTVQDYVLDQYAGYAWDINTLVAKCLSGSVALVLKIDDATAFASLAVGGTEVTGSATPNGNSIAVGNTLEIEVSTASSATNLSFSIAGVRQ